MADLAEVWKEALPELRQAVTGVGIWAALNAAKPIVLEDGVAVLGIDHRDTELAGHLKLTSVKRLIERQLSERMNSAITVRIIEGTSLQDWETIKRRDVEARRLED